jgi:peptidyl-Asp metalloendopeptidase
MNRPLIPPLAASRLLLLVCLVGLLLGAGASVATARGSQRPLWITPTGGPGVQLEEPEWRARLVVLAEPDFLVEGDAGSFDLELFDGERLRIDLVRLEQPRAGSAVWYGELGTPGAGDHLILATTDGAAAASLRYQGRLLRLRGPAEALVLAEVVPTAFQPCGAGERHAVASTPPAGAPPATGAPTSPLASAASAAGQAPGAYASTLAQRVDVLTLWTEAARVGAGGLASILALVDLAVAEVNLAYTNCGAAISVRLVHAAEVVYAEAGDMGSDLARLRHKTDGYMDVVHDLRDQYGADAVALITDQGGYCGMAYIMTNVGPGFESSAFSVTKRSCATGNYTYAHELGHNFGLAHDPDNAGNASHPYAYGYRTPNNLYRTVMAYSPGSRRPIFSSPLHSWDGYVMGVAGSQDNARALTENAPTIAAWRATVIPVQDWSIYCVTSPNSVGAGTLIRGEGSTSVGAGTFALGVSGGVPAQFGLFYYGGAQVQIPFGAGVRCVGSGGLGTYRLPPPQQPGVSGLLLRPVDFSAPPAASGPSALVPGSTWNFQFWYRDPAGAGSSGFNLSNALRASFHP